LKTINEILRKRYKQNNSSGKNRNTLGDGNPEWIIQHEMDHLDGIRIQDKGAVLI